MGLDGISVGSIIVILLMVVLLFGTKKLRSMGGDLGQAVRGFRQAMHEGERTEAEKQVAGSSSQEAEAVQTERASGSESDTGITSEASDQHDKEEKASDVNRAA